MKKKSKKKPVKKKDILIEVSESMTVNDVMSSVVNQLNALVLEHGEGVILTLLDEECDDSELECICGHDEEDQEYEPIGHVQQNKFVN